jgi:hypothetical protein
VLYGAREWCWSARALGARRSRPAEVLAALRADAAFARFEAATAELPRPPGVWRLLDLWLMSAASGLVPGQDARAAAASALAALAVPEAERGPLVLIPSGHATEPRGVSVREAWSWEAAEGGLIRAARADAPGDARLMTADAFADFFVEENFR